MRVRPCLVVSLWLLAWNPICVQLCAWGDAPLQSDAVGASDPFLVKPYLQLGDVKSGKAAEGLVLFWQTADAQESWAVDYKSGPDAAWRDAEAIMVRRIDVPSVAPHRVYRAVLRDLGPGGEFEYRVRRGGKVVFSAPGRAVKDASQPFRFVAFGDCGAGTPEQRAIAIQAYRYHPDFVMVTGDIVYDRGRISEYRERFWPVYNSDDLSPAHGAPLLRSTLFVAAPGNHDIANRDLEKYPDGLAYFLYWDQPRNGPAGAEGGPLVPILKGPAVNREAFLVAAGATYPRMANFSFNYGNAHWTVLDSNPYVDWSDRELRAWVQHDLAAAQGATWRFVAFNHPGFSSARKHFEAQQMRRLADVFEAGQVDVVFSGHVHNYQRTFPMRFSAEKGQDGKLVGNEHEVSGRWSLDKTYDGRTATRPDGVIYVITGAGGNHLYNPEQQDVPGTWQPFTCKFISKVHSLTVADIHGSAMAVRQISATGQELDRFVVTK